jgi:hypothetical protein
LAEALLEDDAVALVRRVIDLAKTGDVTALRLCLERLIPRRVERAIEFEMPSISEPKHAVVALSQITAGIGSGELTANEAHTLVALVEATIKTIDVTRLRLDGKVMDKVTFEALVLRGEIAAQPSEPD